MKPWTHGELANNNFFGNLVNMGMQLEEIRVYLEEVHSFIKITHVNLQSDRFKGLDNDTKDNLKYHFEHTQGDILRKSIILSCVILLEAEIDTYCQDFKKYGNFLISYRDFKGDLLDRFKAYSVKVICSDFDFQSRLWQDISGLYEIRNSLVHNRGSLVDFGKRKVIEEFVRRNKSFEVDENGSLEISHNACLETLKILESFFEEISNYALRHFPERRQHAEDDFPF